MHFNDHSRLTGTHAFLSASKHAWVNYDADRLREVYGTSQAAARGTRLHELAAEHIRLRIRMPKNQVTLNRYINDAIGYRMTPEQILRYSDNAFGTADAISFDEKRSFLRIHDLKTGVTPASMTQLHIYVVLFCLEYGYRPGDIHAETRIYQNNDVFVDEPETDTLTHILDRLVQFDKIIEDLKQEA